MAATGKARWGDCHILGVVSSTAKNAAVLYLDSDEFKHIVT
jgi:hypothetical protein